MTSVAALCALFLLLTILTTTATAYSFIPNWTNPIIGRKEAIAAATTTDITMRAWTCHGRNQKEMVDKLCSANIVKSPQAREALLRVDRANYAPPDSAYYDSPQPIGLGQTISAPHMHAHVLEEMMPTLLKNSINKDELRILDVGCGSGYLTAALGRLVDQKGPIPPLKKGKVFGIDVFSQLVGMSRLNMQKQDGDLFDSDTVHLQVGDGWEGLPEESPYDAIHVGAAAETFPKKLMMQLAVGGVLVVPVGPQGGAQALYKVEKLKDSVQFHEKDFAVRQLLGVRYVPLVHP